MFTWKRYGGYECSGRGDKRFSAFSALMPDGRSIEHHYQCDVKAYCPGGTNWRLGKGKPPLDKTIDLYSEYLKLWQIWAKTHEAELFELRDLATLHGCILSDRFASTEVNQARALADILNQMFSGEENGNSNT